MERKIKWLILSIIIAAVGLVPLAISSILTRDLDNDIVIESIKFIARVIPGLLLFLYMKKVYKIKIGIKREKLFKGIFWHGLALVLFSTAMLLLNYKEPERGVIEVLPVLLFYLVTNLGIGLFEEALCRGVLFNSFKVFFGDTKKGVLGAMFFSSFLFGAIHFGNLNGSNTISTITQVIYATFIGMFFSIIYYRTGNLLSCIILHGMVDYFNSFWRLFSNDRLAQKMVEDTTDSTIGQAIVTLVLTSIFLISALVQFKMEFRKRQKAEVKR